jgi:hypothetical protein
MNTGTKWTALVLALAVGVTTLGADRTARWQDRRGRLAKTAQDIRLSVAHGVNSDGNAQVIPLTDVSNMVMVRDGTALTPREGLEIRKHYNLTSGYGAGTMVILKESAPPDVELGNMFLQIDPSNGLQTVQDIEFMRDRTQLEGQDLASYINFSTNGLGYYEVDGNLLEELDVVITRTGDLSQTAVIRMYTEDGTAIGTDDPGDIDIGNANYLNTDEDITLIPGDTGGNITFFACMNAATDRVYFYVHLEVVSGEGIILQSQRITVYIVGFP